ncbi:MAG: hypothetical protein ACOX5A_11800 [Aminivibrio sp.]|nr:hypothetical protein [Synergistaceae bacterium]
MASLREVSVKIGKHTYYLRTSLDDESLQSITGLTSEIAGGIKNADQENVLLLSCLQLAWLVQKLGRALEQMLDDISDKEEQ